MEHGNHKGGERHAIVLIASLLGGRHAFQSKAGQQKEWHQERETTHFRTPFETHRAFVMHLHITSTLLQFEHLQECLESYVCIFMMDDAEGQASS